MTDLPDPPDHDPRMPAPGDRGMDARALDADERALAERIASAAPPRGPSAELDARILAMAGAPVAVAASGPAPAVDAAPLPMAEVDAMAMASAPSAARPTSSHVARARQRRRWPAMAGIAATLMLTFGLAWQMRPQDAPLLEPSDALRAPMAKAPGSGGPRADDAADSAMAPPPPAAAKVAEEARAPAPIVAEPTMPAAPAAADAPRASPQRAEGVRSGSGDMRGIAPAPAEPIGSVSQEQMAPPSPVAVDAPSPMVTPAPAPASPPAPAQPAPAFAPPPPPPPIAARSVGPSTTAPVAAERSRDAETKRRQQSSAAAEAAADAAAAKASNGRAELDRIEVTGSRIDGAGDQPLDDQPPASADSPAVREAWLARVRQLVADGRGDDARDSLREYRRRHPDAPIPDDLRPLLPAE